MILEIIVFTAIILDLILGDPHWYPHPVRMIGSLAAALEKFFRKVCTSARAAGILTVFSVLFLCCGSVAVLFWLVAGTFWLESILAVALLYSLIAIKDLLHHSRRVHASLYPVEKIDEARTRVGHIVGRNTEKLDAAGVTRACVETVAENMVDGITAPLFWAVVASLFSPLTPLSAVAMAAMGMLAYKCVNTMDSMFGYKNLTYKDFGWAAARLDDLVNVVPARLSAALIVVAAFLWRCNGKDSLRIYRRDRNNHASPNAGHPEAAIAGALNVRLGGPSSYFGAVVDKPYIGDDQRPLQAKDILTTQILILTASALFLFLAFFLRNICFWLH